MTKRLQIRRDTEANWLAANPILLQGEPCYVIDAAGNVIGQKVGNGVTSWRDLPYLSARDGSVTEAKLSEEVRKKLNEPEIKKAEVSVSNTTGAPSATAEVVGDTLKLQFNGIKGDRGDTANMRIEGYVDTVAQLPTGVAIGTAYGVKDSTYTEENPKYRVYVYTSDGWVDNGLFGGISAGVVQETGAGENVVMSQKAVSRVVMKNYAPEYPQFDGVFRKFGMIESVEFLAQNRSVRLKESRGAYAFGFKIDVSNSPLGVGDEVCVGFQDVVLHDGDGYINFACYDDEETRVSSLQSLNIITSDLLSLSLRIVPEAKYIVAFVQGSPKLDVTLGECKLVKGSVIRRDYEFSNCALGDKKIVLTNYAPSYYNFKKALLDNDMDVSIEGINNAVIRSDEGAKVFGFQVLLKDTPFSVGDLVTARVRDVVLNSGVGYFMLLFYDIEKQRLGSVNSINITTSDCLELHKEIPNNTHMIVVRFQSQGALDANVGEVLFSRDNYYGENIQWIRNEAYSGIELPGQSVYVNGDIGDDANNGTEITPLKTLKEALHRCGDNANIVLVGNVYDSMNIKTQKNQNAIRVTGKQGVTSRIILGEKISSATLVQEDVYKYNIATFPSNSTSYCLWQHAIPDSATAISESEKHPLQRGKTHRLDSTKLSRVNSVNEVKSSNTPVFYYDNSNGILYFRVVSGSNLADNPIYLPTPNPAIYGNDGTVKVEFTNIEVWYSNFDLSNCNGGVVTECSAKFGVNGGFSWKDCNGLQLIRCEACGVHDYDNNYGDGFSVGSTISEPTTAKCATAVMYDCWSHDNHDDGYSDHLNNETTIDGGLFEYNDGGITTSYGSKDIVRNVYARNNTEAGITVYGGSAEGTESFVSNCISENNSPYNFSVVNGGTRKTKGTFINCISLNAENTGYYASGSNVEMTVINCYDDGSPIATSANVLSKNCVMV